MGTGKEIVSTSESYRANAVFKEVVVNMQIAVFEVVLQALPEWCDIFNGTHACTRNSHQSEHLTRCSCSGGYYVEKLIEDNLPSVEEALADLKTAWNASLQAEDKFKTILKNYI